MKNNQDNTRTALLVIDVQVGIIDGLNAYRGSEVVETIDNLLAKARAEQTPVIYVQHDGGTGDLLELGSQGWQIHPQITPKDGEPVVAKRACDSFFETELQSELEKRGIDRLVMTGCQTEYCVDTTARRAVTLGYDVVLVGDGHTTVDTIALTAAQIISHHNAVLAGFQAGKHAIAVQKSDEVSF
jgi:nicotinamidase-related amidase